LVLITGGQDSGGYSQTAEIFDPVTGTSVYTGSMSVPRIQHSATLLPNGKVLIAGGEINDPTGPAELYDPTTGTFSLTGSLTTRRMGHTATLLRNGMVLLVGQGGPGMGQDFSAELYDPATESFTSTGSMSVPRLGHAATLLQSGNVLVTGGTIDTLAEIYDPNTGSFSTTGSMNASRPEGRTTGTLLPNGNVLIAGGNGGDASTELYDSSTGTFTLTGSMSVARVNPSTTLLSDGSVLAVGGSDSGGRGVASAELYCPDLGTRLSAFCSAQVTPIEHVVIIIKENRTFDHMFGLYPGANGVSVGRISTGQTIPLSRAVDREPNFVHSFAGAVKAVHGGLMDRFDLLPGCLAPNYGCYSQYQQSDIPKYWAYAQNYVLADNFFSSMVGPSFPNHLYLIASQSGTATSNPQNALNHSWGCDAGPNATVLLLNKTKVAPCFDYQTLGDTLTTAGLSWDYYAPAFNTAGYQWSAYSAINHIRNTGEWAAHVKGVTGFKTRTGSLAAVTWITPPQTYAEHPTSPISRGETWTVQQINSIMASPDWASTVIFVTWDDFGGFYDHVPPPSLGMGARVPLLIISPFVTAGQVCHALGSFDSLLAFVEYNWSVSALTARDAAADPLVSCFNFGVKAPAVKLSEKSKPISASELKKINAAIAHEVNDDDDDK
jgi:phospholipase C